MLDIAAATGEGSRPRGWGAQPVGMSGGGNVARKKVKAIGVNKNQKAPCRGDANSDSRCTNEHENAAAWRDKQTATEKRIVINENPNRCVMQKHIPPDVGQP
eukprot:GHVU01016157.1.p2 GENE.GHVU01016157.1~~GHVU01016157.1.p2  ORF type:complete len:102 (+),score=7.90 GHVU01016157.1:79-384(+)